MTTVSTNPNNSWAPIRVTSVSNNQKNNDKYQSEKKQKTTVIAKPNNNCEYQSEHNCELQPE